jgi:hypothetical protein
MNNPAPYDTIGPFKYVPEEARLRVASLANRASGRALDAALRAGELCGGAHQNDAYRPSPDSVTAQWPAEDHLTRQRKEASFEVILMLVGGSLFSIPSMFAFAAALQGIQGMASLAALLCAAAMVIMGVVYYFGVNPALRALRDIKLQGFAGEALVDVSAHSAGQIWLLAEQALIIASANHKEFSSTRSVFYDAIGSVAVTVEGGFEGVTVTGRDGLVIGRIAKPFGLQGDNTEAIASHIRHLVEKARKAA